MAIRDDNKHIGGSLFDGGWQYGRGAYLPPLPLQNPSVYEATQKNIEVKECYNIALVCERGCKLQEVDNIFIAQGLIDSHLVGSWSYAFPLYLYPTKRLKKILKKER